MTQPWIYQLRKLTKSYGNRTVLRIDQLEVFPGETLGVIGPTGAGKSTLLRLLAGLERPTEGALWFGSQAWHEQVPPLATQRRVAMVFQRPLLLTGSVQTNVAYGLRLHRKNDIPTRVRECLERLDLLKLAAQSARTLSGGQTQLVAVARALALEPQVLLLDEPTANLDPAHVALVESAIEELHQRHGTTVVWATHNLFQAKRRADRVVLLLDGHLVEVNASAAFFQSPQDPRTAAFIRGEMIY